MSISILIVDDHKIFCEGLRALLSQREGLSVAGCACNGEDAVELALKQKPDIILMDILMPGIDGIETTKRIFEQRPQTRIIALSMYTHKHYVTEMLNAGVSGYLVKGCTIDELVNAITSVHQGGTYLSEKIANQIVRVFVNRMERPCSPQPAPLSEREAAVLKMIADGIPLKEIALKLGISIKTAETHRRQILTKLGLSSIVDLVKYAIREGLTLLE